MTRRGGTAQATTTLIEVTFAPTWVNAQWLRMFTDPYVEIDGVVTECHWRRPTAVAVEPGRHEVRTFVRYRRLLPGDNGSATRTFVVDEGETARIEAVNGLLAGDPFVPWRR